MNSKVKITKKMVNRKKRQIARPRQTGIRSAPSASSRRESAPVAQSSSARNSGPRYSSGSNGDIEISHEEYLTNLVGTGTISLPLIRSFPINPGSPLLFPWLSIIAAQYEKYCFKSLQFIYRTRSATSQVGAVCYTVDYDASDPAPTSMVQARNYRSSISDVPWKDFTFEALREDLTTSFRYVRNGAALPTGTDVKMYDLGNLFVVAEGMTGSPVLGELSVRYKVALHVPQSQISAGLFASFTGGTTLSAANLCGSDAVKDVDSTLPLSLGIGANIFFPVAGTFLLTVQVTGTVLAGPFIYTAGPSGMNVTVLSTTVDAPATGAIGLYLLEVLVPGGGFAPKITSATTVTATTFRIAPWSTLV